MSLTATDLRQEQRTGGRAFNLIAAYQDALDSVDRLPHVLWIRRNQRLPGRWVRQPRLRAFVRYFMVLHIKRTLDALTRRYDARSALELNDAGDREDIARVARFRASLPPTPSGKRVSVFVGLTTLLVAVATVRAAFPVRAHENLKGAASVGIPLRDVTMGLVTLERHRVLTGFGEFRGWSAAEGLAIVAVVSWLLLVLPVSSFRLKRIVFNDHGGDAAWRPANWYLCRSDGIYWREQHLFDGLGGKAPREIPFDLLLQAVIVVPLLVAGATAAVLISKQFLHGDRGMAVYAAGFPAVILLAPLGRLLWILRVWRSRGRVAHEPAFVLYASWKRRAAAYLIDAVALIAIWIALLIPLALHDGNSTNISTLWAAFILLALPILGIAYSSLAFLVLGRRHGQTFGKRLVHIRVVRRDGAPITYARWMLREALLKWLLLTTASVWFVELPLVANLLRPLWEPERRTYHDLLSDTVVIRE